MKLSPEFKLAVQCCQQNFHSGSVSAAAPMPARVDWTRFARLVSFHRIEGLAWNALGSVGADVPDEVARSLGKASTQIAICNLQSIAKSSALLERFKTANIPVLFLKGATLGSLAYRNPALKSSIDIDILIEPGDLEASASILRACGFRLAAPASGKLEAWHQCSKESVWVCDSPPLQLDLHTRAADSMRLIPSIDVHSSTQIVDLGNGARLPTLAIDELVAYLAVHGASSAWFRLKWISDFSGLLQGRSRDDLARLYRRSRELGAGRCAGQAFLLADALFSILATASTLRDEIKGDSAVVSLCHKALEFLAAEQGEPTMRRWGTFTIHRTQFDLQSGLSFKASELSRQVKRLFLWQR